MVLVAYKTVTRVTMVARVQENYVERSRRALCHPSPDSPAVREPVKVYPRRASPGRTCVVQLGDVWDDQAALEPFLAHAVLSGLGSECQGRRELFGAVSNCHSREAARTFGQVFPILPTYARND